MRRQADIRCALRSATPRRLNFVRAMGPFLKVLVKCRAFSLGPLRIGSAGRTPVRFSLIGRSTLRGGRVSRRRVRLSSLREAATVLFSRGCSRPIPSRGTAGGNPPAARPGRARPTRTNLVRIPRRPSHSIQSIVRPSPDPGVGAPHPRSHPSWPGREGSRGAGGSSDRTTGPTVYWSLPSLRRRRCNPGAALRPPLTPGTRRMSSACSACAR